MATIEVLSERDMTSIVMANADIMNEMAHDFDVDRQTINMIFSKVNEVSGIEDKRLRVIRKASILFCEIAHCQPFLEGNRTTAYYAGLVFLRRHGFEVPMTDHSDKVELKDLLTRTKQIRIEGITEEKLCEEIEQYLIRKVSAF